MRIAVIGTGISGSLVARLLSTEHEVTVFEANHYAGGHSNTVDVNVFGESFAVDTGFMVFNRQTYPNFTRLLQLLEITSQPADMSFSVRCDRSGIEYQGSSLNGLFAQRHNAIRPSFLRMIGDIVRFNRMGREAAANGGLKNGQSVGEFLHQCRVGTRFIEQYLVPMAAAIWSANPKSILRFPADFMIGFFVNHGLLQFRDRPQWRTILGGSRKYIAALLEPIRDQVLLNAPIKSVTRKRTGVIVKPASGPAECFDQVVMASHADQSLKMLANPTKQEKQILGAFPYQMNQGALHTDVELLPRSRRAWASWNYHNSTGPRATTAVTYDLSRLQNHRSLGPILFTLNRTHAIHEKKILKHFQYAHPAFSRASIAAQKQFRAISGRNRIHFCGAYWGYGFHEDGVNSALAVAQQFGIDLDACTVASTKVPLPIDAVSR